MFDSGDARVKPEGVDVLKEIGNILGSVPDWSISVDGHTDNVPIGSKLLRQFADNQALSLARAKHAALALQRGGLDAAAVIIHGYGDTHPQAPNNTEEGRHKNRRVEVRVTPTG